MWENKSFLIYKILWIETFFFFFFFILILFFQSSKSLFSIPYFDMMLMVCFDLHFLWFSGSQKNSNIMLVLDFTKNKLDFIISKKLKMRGSKLK
jgi:predicted MPP superfamily phosphohydrolase